MARQLKAFHKRILTVRIHNWVLCPGCHDRAPIAEVQRAPQSWRRPNTNWTLREDGRDVETRPPTRVMRDLRHPLAHLLGAISVEAEGRGRDSDESESSRWPHRHQAVRAIIDVRRPPLSRIACHRHAFVRNLTEPTRVPRMRWHRVHFRERGPDMGEPRSILLAPQIG